MEKVKFYYAGERALVKVKKDKKGKPMKVTNNRVILVKGKPYRLEAGWHEVPKADYDQFSKSPVGKVLLERGVLKLAGAAPAEKKADAPKKEEDVDVKVEKKPSRRSSKK